MSSSWPEGTTKRDVQLLGWHRGELDYKLDDLQKKILKTYYANECKSYCILSSRQIGKSYLSVVLAIEHCIRYPNSIVRILAATLKQVSDIVNDNLQPIIADAPEGLIERSKSEYRWRISTSTLRLGTLDRAHVDNNRGGNASLIITEEAGFVGSDDFKYAVNSVLSPQLLRSNGKEIHISSPSEDEYHYLHENIAAKCEEIGTLFRYTVYDSPTLTPKQIEEAARRCGGYDSEAFRREYMAEVIRSKSLMVIPEFDESFHVKPFDLPNFYKAIIAGDYGGSVDCTAGLSVVHDFRRDILLIWNEFFFTPNTPTAVIVPAALRLESELVWQGTPDRIFDMPGQLQIDLSMQHNYIARLPQKDDRNAQLNALRILFAQNKILIHPRCIKLIGCLKTGRYNKRRDDFERSEFYGHCDPLMALVYGNRMIDRFTNPYPAQVIQTDRQMRVGYREEKSNLEEIAKAFMPYQPTRGIGGFN